MTTTHILLKALFAICVALSPGLGTALAQESHEHGHPTTGAAVAQLRLDNGQKWPTDEPLRSGVGSIRAAFDADHPAIYAGTETDAQYDVLATRIETDVNGIVAKCKLPPAADANLHLVIVDLLQGATLMRGKDPTRSRHDGAALVHGALLAYGQ
jgi:hypothetical protein